MEQRGLDPNQRDNDGNTPLHYAAAYGKEEIVKYLIEEGSAVQNVLVNGVDHHCIMHVKRMGIYPW